MILVGKGESVYFKDVILVGQSLSRAVPILRNIWTTEITFDDKEGGTGRREKEKKREKRR